MEIVKLYLFDARRLQIADLLNTLTLTSEDLKELEKAQLESVKKERAVSRHFKNKYIGEYSINEFGKPIAKDKHFNISHSKGVVALAVSDTREIGLDIEVIRESHDDLTRYISSDEEYKYIKNDENFFEVWTSKESLVKCLGTGIKSRIEEIPAFPLMGKKIYKNKNYFSKIIKKDDLIISICLDGDKDFEIDFIMEDL